MLHASKMRNTLVLIILKEVDLHTGCVFSGILSINYYSHAKSYRLAFIFIMYLFIKFIFYFFITIYPLYTLFHIHSPSPHTVSMSMRSLLFSFLLNLSTLPTHSPRAVSLFSIYQSVSIFLVSELCSLESTCK